MNNLKWTIPFKCPLRKSIMLLKEPANPVVNKPGHPSLSELLIGQERPIIDHPDSMTGMNLCCAQSPCRRQSSEWTSTRNTTAIRKGEG